MMKKKTLIFLFLILLCFTLTSCSSFFGEEEAIYVVSVEPNEEMTKMTITYSDGTFKVIDVPQGKDGLTGNGIKGIEAVPSKDGLTQIVTITFTDSNMDPVEFKVNNAVQISGVDSTLDPETHETVIKLKFEDGTVSDEEVRIPAGRGIVDFQTVIDDTGTTITFVYSDGTFSRCFVPTAKGEDGVGIDYIEMPDEETIKELELDPSYYHFFIYFTDPEKEPFHGQFLIPVPEKPEEPNTWHSGEGGPGESLGKNGDFYFDTKSDIIYKKFETTWVEVANLGKFALTVTVIFDYNDGSGKQQSISIDKGSTFATSNKAVPIPTREGYNFIGWYSVTNPNPLVHAAFTDMTPVTATPVKLFAIWEEK